VPRVSKVTKLCDALWRNLHESMCGRGHEAVDVVLIALRLPELFNQDSDSCSGIDR
jgi:hypothetical protein